MQLDSFNPKRKAEKEFKNVIYACIKYSGGHIVLASFCIASLNVEGIFGTLMRSKLNCN